MSEEFKLQKDQKKTMEITMDDLDDINLDELNNENFDASEDSIVFTKEKPMEKINNEKRNNEIKLSDLFGSGGQKKEMKKNSPSRTNVNIKKDNDRPEFSKYRSSPPPKKPIIEPNSVDLGLEHLVNQQKKNIRDEPSEDSQGSYRSRSRSSRGSRAGSDLDQDEFERVKNIMDERSEGEASNDSRRSRDSNGSAPASDLSSLVKEKIKRKSSLTESQRKEELLFLFNKLEKKGFKLNQKFTMRSPLEDMERVYERLEHERNLKSSINFQRKVLMGIVSTLEFLNNSMNPFDIDLEGWSESVMENQNEYDDIFEELYEKYKDKGKVSPEVKLLMTLAGSAFYFHLSKTIVKSGQQKMNEMFGGGAPDLGKGGLGGMMGGLMKNFMSGGGDDEPVRSSGMRGPQGFDDIISEQSNKSSDIPSIHSSVVSGPKKKRTLHF